MLRSESSRDYVDGLLSMEHLPNITVIDMAHIVANHALISRKEDVIKYGYDENGILFKPYNGRVADPENPENVANAIENRLEVSFPWIHQHHKAKYPEMIQDKKAIKFTREQEMTLDSVCLTASMKVIHHQKLNR